MMEDEEDEELPIIELPKARFNVSDEVLAMYNFEEIEVDAHLPSPT